MNLLAKLLLLVIATLSVNVSKGQSFNGTLVYKVTYHFSAQFNKELKVKTIEALRNKGEFFDTLIITIQDGNYFKTDNAPNGKQLTYLAAQNKLYFFTKNSNIVLTTDASSLYPIHVKLPEPRKEFSDSSFVVGNWPCKKLSLIWDSIGQETYYYNKSIAPLEPDLFKNHNYEYLNQVIASTEAYPIKMVKSLNNIMEISIELLSIDNNTTELKLFNLPPLKKANKKQREIIGQITGYEVWVIDE